MQQRSLGNSGLTVSSIGLGLAALGRPGYINLGHEEDLEADYTVDAIEAQAHQVLDAAREAGVRYFDAARSYGRAEEFLSSWLQARNNQDLTVGSKWGYTYTADWGVQAEAHEIKEHSIDVLTKQIAQSRELFGDQLHLYQIHSGTLESGVLENQSVLEKLGELKNSGLKIGLSVSGTKQSEVIRKAVSTEVNGMPLFDTCQATWNILETSASEAHDAGVGIIIKEGLANGRLTSRNVCESFAAKRQVIESMASLYGNTIDALALEAVIAQPWVYTVLSGAASVDHLQSNSAAASIKIDEAAMSQLSALAETPDDYWATRSALAWN